MKESLAQNAVSVKASLGRSLFVNDNMHTTA